MKDTTSISPAGRAWLMGMGCVLALAGLLFAGILFRAWQRADETRQWTEVPCVILNSTVQPLKKSLSSNTVFATQVTYRYEVGGKSYVSSRIRRVDGPSAHLEKAEALRQLFQPGQKTVCYVMPGEPQFAILLHNTRAAIYTLWFPFLFVFGGGMMGWRAWKKKPQTHA